MDEANSFREVARQQLSFLIDDRDFTVVAEDEYHVRLESESVGVEASYEPLGEVEVRVFRLGQDDPHESWTYTGMVGRASASRLLSIAIEQMTANPAILSGDATFYERRGAENRRLSEAWTAYYSGKGPQPTGKLP
jgi:hypothetical protein